MNSLATTVVTVTAIENGTDHDDARALPHKGTLVAITTMTHIHQAVDTGKESARTDSRSLRGRLASIMIGSETETEIEAMVAEMDLGETTAHNAETGTGTHSTTAVGVEVEGKENRNSQNAVLLRRASQKSPLPT